MCNAYDGERTPRGSGSAVSVAANLVTCSIGEETGTSIRIPSSSSTVVGLSAMQELIPNAGQINALVTLNLRPAARKCWGFSDRAAAKHDRRSR